jgi:hypothetical protein
MKILPARLSLLILLFKITIAFFIPITGDEAYFALWGQDLDFGYYDHPPMVGWVIGFVLMFSKHILALRLPAILCIPVLAHITYLYFKRHDLKKAQFIYFVLILSPVNFLTILITTDIPLVYFSFLSCLLFFISETASEGKNYCITLCSGLFLGCALLSKYFAGMFAIAFAVYFLIRFFDTPSRRGVILKKFIIIFISSLSLFAISILYNYYNGWPNVMFNIINRNQGLNFSWMTLVSFILMSIYFILPILTNLMGKKNLLFFIRSNLLLQLYFLVPNGIFLVLSCFKPIGLHWVFTIYALFPILVSMGFRPENYGKIIKRYFYYALFHLVFLVSGLVILKTDFVYNLAKKHKNTIYLTLHPDQLEQDIKQIETTFTSKPFFLTSESYSFSSTLEYLLNRRVGVFGQGSYHARHHDYLDHYENLNNQDIIIISRKLFSKAKIQYYEQFFANIEVKRFKIEKLGTEYEIMIGHGFKYDQYKTLVLQAIYQKYYQIPELLKYKQHYLSKYGF